MPTLTDLPDVLTRLARRNALEISDTRFDYDVDRLIKVLTVSSPPSPTRGWLQDVYAYVERTAWLSWLIWMLACSLGWAVAWATGSPVSEAVLGAEYHAVNGTNVWVVGGIAGGVVGGALGGAVAATVQWIVLHRPSYRFLLWVLTSTVGWAAGWAVVWSIVWAVDGVVGEAMVWAIGGVAAATVQWLVLRRRVYRSGWWVLATAVGWAVDWAVVAVVGETVGRAAGDVVGRAVFLTLGGTTIGTITGGALLWLLQQAGPDA